MRTVPTVGTQIACNILRVVHEENDAGVMKTPVTKIRHYEDVWQQVGLHEAGMLVFFVNEPDPTHIAFEVVSIIPSKTACYAKLI